MVFSSKGTVCGFAGSDLPVTIYPNNHGDTSALSVQWSLTLEAAERLAADILAAVQAVRSAPPTEACPRCGSKSGVQFATGSANKGCTGCTSLSDEAVREAQAKPVEPETCERHIDCEAADREAQKTTGDSADHGPEVR